jgi:signal transduction histidine kinase
MTNSDKTLVMLSNELNEIFENAATSLILVDDDVKVLNINRSGIEMTGLNKESVIGKLGGEVMSCANAQVDGHVVCGKGINCGHCNLRGLVNTTFLTGTNQYKVEGVLDVNKDGHILRLDLLLSTSLISIEGSKYALITIDDITKLKQQERLLVQENNDKERFLSILAHDLKSPFNSLMGFSDLLLEHLHEYDLEIIESQIRIISQTTHKTFELLEEILLWIKSHSGKLKFVPEEFEFIGVSEEVLSTFSDRLSGKNMSIKLFQSETILLNTDKNMFKTILRNLISNAIKFTNDNGLIKIFALKTQNEIVISVSDNGIGMDKEVIAQLWNDQYSKSNKGTNEETGTGFGLKLCKELIEKQGGRIWVESEVGKGSSFKFTIPK